MFSLRRLRIILTLTMLAVLAPRIAASANPSASAASASDTDPYIAAANDAGVPLPVLVAIAGAESAYHPWALDIEGRQVFCKSRAEAETVLANTATTNVDIGVMQINWRFWGPRLGIAKDGAARPAHQFVNGRADFARQSGARRFDLARHQQLSFGSAARARALQQAGLQGIPAISSRRYKTITPSPFP